MAETQPLGIPTKSEAYLQAQDLFYRDFNEVFFYVEDTDSEEFYFQILKKLFPDIPFSNIFPLGGKKNVIQAAATSSSDNSRVYIVDKDFDDLFECMYDFPNLFYLQRYSIENYLIEEEAVIAFIVSRKPQVNRKIISKLFSFTPIYTEILLCFGQLIPVFLLVPYCAGDKPPTTSVSVDRFIASTGSHALCEKALSQFTKELLLSIAGPGNDTTSLVAKAEQWSARINLHDFEALEKHVPGKMTCKAMLKILQRKFTYLRNTTYEQFCYAMAVNGNLEKLSSLRTLISRYIAR